MAEEKPICRYYRDSKDQQRPALHAACVKLPGRPVNKCPDRALFSCSVTSVSPAFVEYTYRANAAFDAKVACAGYGGRLEIGQ